MLQKETGWHESNLTSARQYCSLYVYGCQAKPGKNGRKSARTAPESRENSENVDAKVI